MVENKDWYPAPALLTIAQAQKSCAIRNKGGLQYGNTNRGEILNLNFIDYINNLFRDHKDQFCVY